VHFEGCTLAEVHSELLEAVGARATASEPGSSLSRDTNIGRRARTSSAGGTREEDECVTGARHALVVTRVWTCVLLRPIVARVIKIFEPMNIPASREAGTALALVADVGDTGDSSRHRCSRGMKIQRGRKTWPRLR